MKSSTKKILIQLLFIAIFTLLAVDYYIWHMTEDKSGHIEYMINAVKDFIETIIK